MGHEGGDNVNVKKEVFDQIAVHIKKEYENCRHNIWMNKYNFRKLADEQTILKRKLGELHDLYNYCIKRKTLEEAKYNPT